MCSHGDKSCTVLRYALHLVRDHYSWRVWIWNVTKQSLVGLSIYSKNRQAHQNVWKSDALFDLFERGETWTKSPTLGGLRCWLTCEDLVFVDLGGIVFPLECLPRQGLQDRHKSLKCSWWEVGVRG